MKLKTIVGVALIGLAAANMSGCSRESVQAGYQGVLVNLYGSDKGISATPMGVGRYWLSWNQELYTFPTFLQNYTWTANTQDNNQTDESITMQTSEGLSISSDCGITYQISPDNVVKVFQKYRLGIQEITNTFLRNMVRDAMNQVSSTMTVEQLYGPGKSDFIAKVNQIVKAEAAVDGINIDKIYLIGSFRLPQTVIDSINMKIQASQKAMQVENEVATARAEAQKTIIEAQARATANETLAKSITPEYLQYLYSQRWDGKLPQVTGNGGVPFIKLNGAVNEKTDS